MPVPLVQEKLSASSALNQLSIPVLSGLAGVWLLSGCSPPASEQALQHYQLSSNAVALPHFSRFTIDARLIHQVFLEREYVHYVQAHGPVTCRGQRIESFEQFRSQVWAPFIAEVEKRFQKLRPEHPADPLGALKLALFEVLGPNLKYNRDCASVLDPLLRQRLQCRSGTQLFALAAVEVLSARASKPEEGFPLCIAFLDEHMLPVLVHEGPGRELQVTGYEMTKRGLAKVEFGSAQKLNQGSLALRIATAKGSQLITILDLNEAPAGTVLLEVQLSQGAAGNPRLCGSEKLAFASGKVRVPAGDLDLDSADSLPASTYLAPEMLVPDAAAATDPQYVSLEKALSADERKVVRDYLRYNAVFSQWWDAHVEVVENKSLAKRERLARLDRIIAEMHQYWLDQGLPEKYAAAQATVEAKGLQFVVHPAHTHDAIANNRRYIDKKE